MAFVEDGQAVEVHKNYQQAEREVTQSLVDFVDLLDLVA